MLRVANPSDVGRLCGALLVEVQKVVGVSEMYQSGAQQPVPNGVRASRA